MSVLDQIVKASDIRGTVPDQLDVHVARAFGVAFASFVHAEQVVVGRDMRPSGPALVDAFSTGLLEQGVDVVDVGIVSTDLLSFASGTLGVPGAMVTASHEPAGHNGIRFTSAGARAIGIDNGLAEISLDAERVLDGGGPRPAARAGSRSHRDLLDDYVAHVLGFVDASLVGPLRVVADTANGMGGLVVPAVLERLPGVELEVMYPELDGTFPNHDADPHQLSNQRDVRARVVTGGFDLALAVDGDADRVFVIDDGGEGMSGSTTTALLATAMLRRHPGATIAHNLICSRAVPEVVLEQGGLPVRTRVGHAHVARAMAETGAVFGGEHSAHYHFARHFDADSGLIAALILMEEVGREAQPMSVVRKPVERYASSGEINTETDDAEGVLDRVAAEFADRGQDRLDGLTVECGSWWFNLRKSRAEPVLRINLEATNRAACDDHVAELLSMITS